jgi:hypothetical protein
MSEYIPIIVVLLALVAAGSIVYLAWELTSKDLQSALERSLGRGTGDEPGEEGVSDAKAASPAGTSRESGSES